VSNYQLSEIDANQASKPIAATGCVVAYEIVADYDGNAPDVDLAMFASLSLAAAAKEILRFLDQDYNNAVVVGKEAFRGLACHQDGWEDTKRYEIRETVCREGEAYRSLADWLASASESWEV
jgi:hypothetical protein